MSVRESERKKERNCLVPIRGSQGYSNAQPGLVRVSLAPACRHPYPWPGRAASVEENQYVVIAFRHGACSGFDVRHTTRMENQGARGLVIPALPSLVQPPETRQKDRTRNGEAGGVPHTYGVSEGKVAAGDRR